MAILRGVVQPGETVRLTVPIGRAFSLIINNPTNGGHSQTVRFNEQGVALDDLEGFALNVNVNLSAALGLDSPADTGSLDEWSALDNMGLLHLHRGTSTPAVPQSIIDNLPKLSAVEANSTECAICFQALASAHGSHAIRLPCSHAFHKLCISPWLAKHDACPLCRSAVRHVFFISTSPSRVGSGRAHTHILSWEAALAFARVHCAADCESRHYQGSHI